MTGINTITICGNLTADPDLRHTGSEIPYVKLRVAVSHRIQNATTKEWEDRTDGFFVVKAWRGLAENARVSLRRGDRVTVTGRLTRRPYDVEGEDGVTETRHSHEIEADDVAPSLRWTAWTRVQVRPIDGGYTSSTPGGGRDDRAVPVPPDGSAELTAASAGGRSDGSDGHDGHEDDDEEVDVAPAA